jgi:hypothetical protein
MTALQVIALIALIVAIAGVISYLLQSGKDTDDQPTIETLPEYTQEELDNIKLAEELYNKDLRPVVVKKPKTKPAPELEVIEPEFVAKVVETSKVFPEDTIINAEALIETKESKPEFPIDKPVKKKRKYYPKKKK